MPPRLTVLFFVLVLTAIALAQPTPEPVISYELEFWASGTTPGVDTAILSTSWPAASAICNQAPSTPPTGTVVNPDTVTFPDPLNLGRECNIVLTQATTIYAVPIGTYTATLRARGQTTLGPRSAASNPFSRAVILVPATIPEPVRLRVR